MKSVMRHVFSEVPKVEIPRSSFDRSHGVKTTFDAGYLVPILVDEALPGDTFNVNVTGFARIATPVYPIMDNMRMETFFFAVPMRLVWDNWQKFCGERVNPNDISDSTKTGVVVFGAFLALLGPIELGIAALTYRYRDWETDRKSTRLNSSHSAKSRMPSSA